METIAEVSEMLHVGRDEVRNAAKALGFQETHAFHSMWAFTQDQTKKIAAYLRLKKQRRFSKPEDLRGLSINEKVLLGIIEEK